MPQTNEKYMSVEYGCVTFFDSVTILGDKLDNNAKNLSKDAFIYLKQEFGRNCKVFKKKMAYPYDFYQSKEDYEKPIIQLQELGKEAYYSNLNDDYPDRNEIDRTNQFIDVFKIKNGRELSQLYNEANVIFIAECFENV